MPRRHGLSFFCGCDAAHRLGHNTGVLRKNSECESRSFLGDLQAYTASNQDVLLFAFQTDVPAADLATNLELDGLDADLLDMPQNPDNALEDCLTDVGELLLNAGADAEHIAYFSFPVSSSTHADLEGAVNFSLDIKDNYSNGKTYNYPAVLDFTPPSLVGGGATKALYNAADVPQMSFNFSEPVFGEGICVAVECLTTLSPNHFSRHLRPVAARTIGPAAPDSPDEGTPKTSRVTTTGPTGSFLASDSKRPQRQRSLRSQRRREGSPETAWRRTSKLYGPWSTKTKTATTIKKSTRITTATRSPFIGTRVRLAHTNETVVGLGAHGRRLPRA